MVAMGAAIGANCIPCFDHLYAKARELRLSEGFPRFLQRWMPFRPGRSGVYRGP
jgi:hypothetical protein